MLYLDSANIEELRPWVHQLSLDGITTACASRPRCCQVGVCGTLKRYRNTQSRHASYAKTWFLNTMRWHHLACSSSSVAVTTQQHQ